MDVFRGRQLQTFPLSLDLRPSGFGEHENIRPFCGEARDVLMFCRPRFTMEF